ncbi:MAG: type II toxin-antitoxin system VapC family toxin [Deltaproteobacteria bacterium]|nr:type II toxin-antitoxin system VapC family toxin [Deltaproteobacteria bacterium]
MIIDTDVLIWYLRGNEKAYQAIENSTNFFISVVTYMELVQGMRNKKELNNLRKALHIWNAKILYLSEEISIKAMFYVEQHFLSHSMQLADALIGATAITYANPILTGNDKHYKVMKDLQIKRFRP